MKNSENWYEILRDMDEKRKKFKLRAKEVINIMSKFQYFIHPKESVTNIDFDFDNKVVLFTTEIYYHSGKEEVFYEIPIKLLSMSDEDVFNYYEYWKDKEIAEFKERENQKKLKDEADALEAEKKKYLEIKVKFEGANNE